MARIPVSIVSRASNSNYSIVCVLRASLATLTKHQVRFHDISMASNDRGSSLIGSKEALDDQGTSYTI